MVDAHVHMGYYLRADHAEPFYYSPRRIVGLMNRCGVDEFVVSSTCAQVEEISIADMIREAREMKRLAGTRAHVFCWISGRMLDSDPGLKFLDCGAYEGIKLHEAETAWNRERPDDLARILTEAQTRQWPVQFHCGESEDMRPTELAKWAERFPSVNFDFAHCRPMAMMAEAIATHENIFTDCSYMPSEHMSRLVDFDWRGRLMFGSDFPAYHSQESMLFSRAYRNIVSRWQSVGFDEHDAFRRFFKIP